jgi:hypothetical protein
LTASSTVTTEIPLKTTSFSISYFVPSSPSGIFSFESPRLRSVVHQYRRTIHWNPVIQFHIKLENAEWYAGSCGFSLLLYIYTSARWSSIPLWDTSCIHFAGPVSEAPRELV